MNCLIKIAVLAIALTGCSFETVEPATKGKILTTSGYQPDVLEPGKYTTWFRQRLVTIDTSTNTYMEPVTVKLADKLELSADVRFRSRISGSDDIINAMFNDIKPGNDQHVSFEEVYQVYGQMVVRNVAREVLSPYNVDEVHLNYSRLSEEIAVALREGLANTPIEISEVALGNIEYPQVVVTAINEAEQRRLQIEREEAQAAIDLLKIENSRAIAEANYQVEMTRAETIRDTNATIAEGITPEILALRQIEALEKMADNGSAVFMPFQALETDGASVRMFNTVPRGNE